LRLLLDTHIALWTLTDDPRLSQAARALILDPANEVCVSAVTLWEIAIKHGPGREGPGAMPIGAHDAQVLFGAAGYSLIPSRRSRRSSSRPCHTSMPTPSIACWSRKD
jgi:hypothetical protein